jgi:hypothetical protein
MAGGYAQLKKVAVVLGAAALLGSGTGILSGCSDSSQSALGQDQLAAKAAVDKAAATQVAVVKAAGAKFLAEQAKGESAAAKLHPLAKAAAACGIPVGDVQILKQGSRIGPPDVPKRGDMWRVKAKSAISPGMIIYWPDGASVLCR